MSAEKLPNEDTTSVSTTSLPVVTQISPSEATSSSYSDTIPYVQPDNGSGDSIQTIASSHIQSELPVVMMETTALNIIMPPTSNVQVVQAVCDSTSTAITATSNKSDDSLPEDLLMVTAPTDEEASVSMVTSTHPLHAVPVAMLSTVIASFSCDLPVVTVTTTLFGN